MGYTLDVVLVSALRPTTPDSPTGYLDLVDTMGVPPSTHRLVERRLPNRKGWSSLSCDQEDMLRAKGWHNGLLMQDRVFFGWLMSVKEPLPENPRADYLEATSYIMQMASFVYKFELSELLNYDYDQIDPDDVECFIHPKDHRVVRTKLHPYFLPFLEVCKSLDIQYIYFCVN